MYYSEQSLLLHVSLIRQVVRIFKKIDSFFVYSTNILCVWLFRSFSQWWDGFNCWVSMTSYYYTSSRSRNMISPKIWSVKQTTHEIYATSRVHSLFKAAFTRRFAFINQMSGHLWIFVEFKILKSSTSPVILRSHRSFFAFEIKFRELRISMRYQASVLTNIRLSFVCSLDKGHSKSTVLLTKPFSRNTRLESKLFLKFNQYLNSRVKIYSDQFAF